jgi:kynurenine formamidase
MSETQTTAPAFKELGKRISNWGRWGEDDEIGTLNLITPERILAARDLIRTGKVIDCGIPFESNGPQPGGVRFNPVHTMSIMPGDFQTEDGFLVVDDVVTMPLQCATQWDSLAHVGYDDLLYNNTPTSVITGMGGAARNSIDKTTTKMLGRGVLLDIARVKGTDILDGDAEITPADLEAAMEAHKVEIGSGDIVLFRTGWRRKFLETNAVEFMASEPGLGLGCAEWLRDRDVAIIASDNWAVEVLPVREPGATLPFHAVAIRDLGMTLGEMFDLERLADDCEADGVYEFFFCSPPLKVSRAVGSPITPVAIK